MGNKFRVPRAAAYDHQAKRLNHSNADLPGHPDDRLLPMSDTVKPIADEVFKKAALTEPLPPTAFTSDGCSLWFDGDWVECCVLHDLAYWRGGTSEERQKADRALEQCVAARGHIATAGIMYAGVRVGGAWWLPTCFRWGYGWAYPQSGPPGTGY
jgi:hypothetical protein